jgi:lipid-binding SYLF domain-containing protein
MQNRQQQHDFSETVQIEAPQDNAAAPQGQADAATDVDLWPEASDFQCSQSASLFAGSQNGPLTVV